MGSSASMCNRRTSPVKLDLISLQQISWYTGNPFLLTRKDIFNVHNTEGTRYRRKHEKDNGKEVEIIQTILHKIFCIEVMWQKPAIPFHFFRICSFLSPPYDSILHPAVLFSSISVSVLFCLECVSHVIHEWIPGSQVKVRQSTTTAKIQKNVPSTYTTG